MNWCDKMKIFTVAFFSCLCVTMMATPRAYADARQQYMLLLQQAASGQLEQTAENLRRQASSLSPENPWRGRMLTAASLLEMRMQQQPRLPAVKVPTLQQQLAQQFIVKHPAPEPGARWPVVILAVLLPGSGHALLGRWHDAWVVAILVWPMLGLTLWAAKRSMGPVTVFFALITLWLWSGSVYSALSLHERSMLEQYFSWWQGVWSASGLPGRPW